jgi:hypothetical protein
VKRSKGFGNSPLFLTLSHSFEHSFVKVRALFTAALRRKTGRDRKNSEAAASGATLCDGYRGVFKSRKR